MADDSETWADASSDAGSGSGWGDDADAAGDGWGAGSEASGGTGSGLGPPEFHRGLSEISCASGWGSLGGDEEAQNDLVMSIPVESENRLLVDLAELNCTSRFRGVDDLKDSTRAKVRLGLKLDSLSMSREQKRALGLNDSQFMVVDAEFGAHYLWEGERPRITVGHADSLDVASPTLEKFALSWTIEDRIKSGWLNRDEKWPPVAESVLEDPLFPSIRDTMEMTGQGYVIVRAALQLFKTKDAACLQLCSDEGVEAVKTHLAGTAAAAGASQSEKSSRAPRPGGPGTSTTGLSGLAQSVLHRISRFRGGRNKAAAPAASPQSDALPAAAPAPAAAEAEAEAGASVAESDIASLAARFRVPDSVAALALETSGGSAAAAQDLLATPEERARLVALNADENAAYERLRNDEAIELQLASHNVLVRLMRFATMVLANAAKACMICDDPLDFVGVKPAVCSKPPCIFSYEEFGLGFDLAWEIVHQPELVDMVISFAVSACNANRVDMVFPSGVRADDPSKPSEPLTLSFNLPDGQPDTTRLKACLDQCPSLEELKGFAGRSALKFELDKLDPLLYPLLRWLLTSNRAHLRLLEPSERIKEVDTPWQFVFVTSAPEREAEFQRLRKQAAVRRGGAGKTSKHGKDGAIQTWHGSPLGNWHSIMRTGLRNMSGTKNQLHGAAYGAGIYMAVNMNTSVGYCRMQQTQGWSKSLFGHSIYCLALCEVVDHEDLKEPKPFFVVPQEEWVLTRFFFVMDVSTKGTSRQSDVKAADIQVPDVYAGR